MRRREVILLLGGAVPWALGASAQQPRAGVHRIGMLETVSLALNAANLDAFRKGLRDLGYYEGQNYVIEYRSADGDAERFPELAAELVGLSVDIIITRGTPATRAAMKASTTIPIVMAAVADPPGQVVDSLARPGGRVTGLSSFMTELQAKRVELVKDVIPGIARIAMLNNMENPATPPIWEETRTAARTLAIEAEILDVRSREDLGRAFETAVTRHIGAVLVGMDGLLQANRRSIADLAAKNKLPAVYGSREFVEVGGLMSFGVSYPTLYSRAANFVDKIFKGAKPADLPVEQPTKLELLINLKAAEAIVLTVPRSILARADEVIE
jgi:putative ABC transport system substrate-binding protein